MRYINKEYGFEGRPPEFYNYKMESDSGFIIKEENFPSESYSAFGLDYKTPNGGLICTKNGIMWGVELNVFKGTKWIAAKECLTDRGKYLAISADASFAYYNYGNVSVSMVRYGKNSLIISALSVAKSKIRFRLYSDNSAIAEFVNTDNLFFGKDVAKATTPGNVKFNKKNPIINGRYYVIDDEVSSSGSLFAKTYPVPKIVETGDGEIFAEFSLDKKKSRAIIFVTTDVTYENEFPSEDELIAIVNAKELDYTAEKLFGIGALCENATQIVSNYSFNGIYDPYLMERVACENRKFQFGFYNYASDEAAKAVIIESVLGIKSKSLQQFACHDHAMGALSVWLQFCRSGDATILKDNFEKLKLLFKSDSSLEIANKNSSYKLEIFATDRGEKIDLKKGVYSLEYSCYKLLTFDILSKMSKILGNEDVFKKLYDELSFGINGSLYNAKTMEYSSKYIDGDFILLDSPTQFLPMIAGAVTELDRLQVMLLKLKNPNRFWKGSLCPTTAIPQCYHDAMTTRGEQLDFTRTGLTDPALNYLIYLGLVRVGAEEITYQFAERCQKAFGEYLLKEKGVPQYFAEKHTIWRKEEVHSLSGNLMGIMGLNQLLDSEIFSDDGRISLRFGTLDNGNHRIANIKICKHNFKIVSSNSNLSIDCDNRSMLKCKGSNIVVRNFTFNTNGCQFFVMASDMADIELTTPFFGKQPGNIKFIIKKGTTYVSAENNQIQLTQNINMGKEI